MLGEMAEYQKTVVTINYGLCAIWDCP